jgi:hypothetical protein
VNLIEVRSDIREKAITKYEGYLQEEVDVMALKRAVETKDTLVQNHIQENVK